MKVENYFPTVMTLNIYTTLNYYIETLFKIIWSELIQNSLSSHLILNKDYF